MAKVRKAVTMSDIAKRMDVSTVTVSKALSGQKGVSEEVREEIIRLAREMGYKTVRGTDPGDKTGQDGISHWRPAASGCPGDL